MSRGIRFYDRDGRQISLWEFEAHLRDPHYRRIAESFVGKGTVDEIRISTIWLGIDYSWTDDLGAPNIFETMIFAPTIDSIDMMVTRYTTDVLARDGHFTMEEIARLMLAELVEMRNTFQAVTHSLNAGRGTSD